VDSIPRHSHLRILRLARPSRCRPVRRCGRCGTGGGDHFSPLRRLVTAVVRRPLMFDFGIADLVLLGPGEQEVYLVEFRCHCAVIVARGHVIRRTRGFSLVCEHVSAGC